LEGLRETPDCLPQAMAPLEAGLAELTCIAVDRDGATIVRRGQKLLLRGSHAPGEGPAYVACFGSPIAFGVVESGYFVSTRVFNLAG
jgi:tRNA pseudouridine55 synthase